MGTIYDLPKDIILDILSRLPAEIFLECKLVCKPWKDVVHHRSFSQMHLNHHLLDSGKSSFIFSSLEHEPEELYYAEYDENCHEVPFNRNVRINLSPSLFNKYGCSLAGSCNGLICFNSYYKGYYGPVYICNPITREYVILPELEGQCWCTGFGYIRSTNEYKVVRIYESGGDSHVGIVQVYTLGSGTGWRNVGTMDIDMLNVSKVVGALANGSLHWVTYEGTIILAFHLADEKFSKLQLPLPSLKPADVRNVVITLGVLGDFLSATYYYMGGVADIWLLKKNKDNNDLGWSKEFNFYCNNISLPFGYTKSGRLLYHANGEICSYSAKDSSAKRDVSFGKFVSEAIPHENTFVSLKVLGEEDTKTMGSGKRASSSEEAEHNNKLKMRRNEVRDL